VGDGLEKLGLTNDELSSAKPKYAMVSVAANWTVVSIDPAPGTAVKPDDAVVVMVTNP
jgi:beta-lactam-binding protein with PASTA domain